MLNRLLIVEMPIDVEKFGSPCFGLTRYVIAVDAYSLYFDSQAPHPGYDVPKGLLMGTLPSSPTQAQ